MKNFYQYLAEAKKDYSYRIKMICDEVNDDVLDRIEHALRRYDVIEISKPHKTIFHNSPIDFKDIPGAEVWIFDIKTAQPASSHYIMQEISNSLALNQKFVVVRGSNDPVEREVQHIEDGFDIAQQAADQNLKPGSLLDSEDYAEHSSAFKDVPAYGNDYNSKLLNYLAQVQANRPDMTAPEKHIKQGLFKWMGAETPAADDFNKDVGAVTPVPASTKRKGDEPQAMPLVGRTGAFEEPIDVPAQALYQDDKGNSKTVTSSRRVR